MQAHGAEGGRVMSWYSTMPSDVTEAARATAGNWRAFGSFAWSGGPQHRPEDCAIIYLSNRDSDCLDKSNEAHILAALAPCLGSLDDGDMCEFQSHNHWAVGHVDGIVIRCVDEQGEPTWAFRKLHELAENLDTYPVLDDEDFSRREHEAAQETWRTCYRPAERVRYIREHRSQFEFTSLTDMMGCVRGDYFAGYASELLQP
jgi:hypothetical protein